MVETVLMKTAHRNISIRISFLLIAAWGTTLHALGQSEKNLHAT